MKNDIEYTRYKVNKIFELILSLKDQDMIELIEQLEAPEAPAFCHPYVHPYVREIELSEIEACKQLFSFKRTVKYFKDEQETIIKRKWPVFSKQKLQWSFPPEMSEEEIKEFLLKCESYTAECKSGVIEN